jgi:hypothetical protein
MWSIWAQERRRMIRMRDLNMFLYFISFENGSIYIIGFKEIGDVGSFSQRENGGVGRVSFIMLSGRICM